MLRVAFVLVLLCVAVWGQETQLCKGETSYYLTVSLPWNKKIGVLPRYHLTVSKLIFIVHSEKFRPWKDGREASNGLAKLAETGDTSLLMTELAGSGHIVEASRLLSDSGAAGPSFTANITLTPVNHYLTIAGRVERTPDWFIGSKKQDLCNGELFFGGPKWKIGDYEEMRLMDAGTKLTPSGPRDLRRDRVRPLKTISYSRQTGYVVNRQGSNNEPAVVGNAQALERACPVFGVPSYPVGSSWNDGPCTECKCIDINQDVCVRQHCAPPSCEYFVFEPHICCPVCQNQEEYYSLLENVRNPDRPVIVKKPRNVSVVLGEPFTVDCTAWGDPKPQVVVSRNQGRDYPHIHLEINKGDAAGLASANIKVAAADHDNVGRYTCFVNSLGGEVEEHAFVTISNGYSNRDNGYGSNGFI